MQQDEPGLTLPHPRAHERDFVLRPWLEVDPDAVLPGSGRVADLVAALDVGRPPGGHPVTRSTPGPLIAIGVIGTVIGILVQAGLAAMNMPKLRPEYSLGLTLLLVAAAAITLAVPVRRATRGNPVHRIDPFYATRVVVLAKACALGGALIAGFGLGLVLELILRSGEPGADAYLRVLSVLGRRPLPCSPPVSSPSSSARCRRPTTRTPTRERRPRPPGSVGAVTDDASQKKKAPAAEAPAAAPTAQAPTGLDPVPGEWRRVSPKYIVVDLIGTLITGVIMTVASGVPWFITQLPLFLLLPAFFAVMAIVLAAFTPRRVRSIGYMFRDDDLLFRKGIMFQRFVSVPYGRMQLVDINRGPLARAVGLSELKLVTAAAASNITIPGLPEKDAEELRDHLVALAESRRAGL